MGADLHTDTIIGPFKSAIEAYNELVQNARHLYGHNPYNGTIATTRLTKVIDASNAPRPGTKKWDALLTELWNSQSKRECTAVEIKPGKYFKTLKESKYGKGSRKRNIKAYKFIICAAC